MLSLLASLQFVLNKAINLLVCKTAQITPVLKTAMIPYFTQSKSQGLYGSLKRSYMIQCPNTCHVLFTDPLLTQLHHTGLLALSQTYQSEICSHFSNIVSAVSTSKHFPLDIYLANLFATFQSVFIFQLSHEGCPDCSV